MTNNAKATESDRRHAEGVIRYVRANGQIEGQDDRGRRALIPITLERLAAYGVPANLTLPFETQALRDLVQELAQIASD